MGEILLPDCQFPRLSDGATCRDIRAEALCQACTAHVQVAALRTRLESVEAARRDAQESRFALIIENEELGADLADASARPESAEQERAKLQAFKSWVHAYLDAHGVPHHPPGAHGAEGCRIGDRLDWLLAQRDRLEKAEAALREAQESRMSLIIETEELGAELADARDRLESAEAAMKRIADYTEKAGREDGGMLWAVWEIARAALGAAGQERQHLICSACGRSSDTEPRGGLCGMPRPPLGICCGRFRAALSTTGEKESRSDG